mmetsp:Transcript_91182/g.258218  ORF Transcript_91182/g.258218 Transcript_91182/m.258218 type:complete len:221 (+) Transcript_91182:787-1449(+)
MPSTFRPTPGPSAASRISTTSSLPRSAARSRAVLSDALRLLMSAACSTRSFTASALACSAAFISGDSAFLFGEFTLALASSRHLTTSSTPGAGWQYVAKCRGVSRRMLAWFTEAWASIMSSTISSDRSRSLQSAAKWSAVQPLLFTLPTSAFWLTSSATTSVWPAFAASCTATAPYLRTRSQDSRICCTCARSPLADARTRAVAWAFRADSWSRASVASV